MEKTITAALYARVSTVDQNNEMQLHDLRLYAQRMGWETVEFEETESSVKTRPIFRRMLDQARVGKFQVILVWRIDRFARSMKDFVLTTMKLQEWKVGLVSVTENVDTRDESPFSEFHVGLLALLAELERNIILSRVNAGIAEAQRKGKHCGRPVKIWRRDEGLAMQMAGKSLRAIARELNVPLSTVKRGLKAVPKGVERPDA